VGRLACLEGCRQGLAVAGWSDPGMLGVTFKVSEMAFDILREQPGLRPAPYLASRGMTWIQRTGDETMDDAALADYLRESHRLVASKLPARQRLALGLG
jgi:predicted DNA-binding protein (MmcQ/YjbR family)